MRLPPFPRPYLFQKLDSSRGPSLREVIRPRFLGTTAPSDFLLAPGRFGSALSPRPSHSRAPRRISPVPLSAVLPSRPLYPGGSPAGDSSPRLVHSSRAPQSLAFAVKCSARPPATLSGGYSNGMSSG